MKKKDKRIEKVEAAIEERQRQDEHRERAEMNHQLALFLAAHDMKVAYAAQYRPEVYAEYRRWDEARKAYEEAAVGYRPKPRDFVEALHRGRPQELMGDETYWELENKAWNTGIWDGLILPETPDHELLEKTAKDHRVPIAELRERYIKEAWEHNDLVLNPDDTEEIEAGGDG